MYIKVKLDQYTPGTKSQKLIEIPFSQEGELQCEENVSA
jgi:hypothetical protein